jgi:hypothetical protein
VRLGISSLTHFFHWATLDVILLGGQIVTQGTIRLPALQQHFSSIAKSLAGTDFPDFRFLTRSISRVPGRITTVSISHGNSGKQKCQELPSQKQLRNKAME